MSEDKGVQNLTSLPRRYEEEPVVCSQRLLGFAVLLLEELGSTFPSF